MDVARSVSDRTPAGHDRRFLTLNATRKKALGEIDKSFGREDFEKDPVRGIAQKKGISIDDVLNRGGSADPSGHLTPGRGSGSNPKSTPTNNTRSAAGSIEVGSPVEESSMLPVADVNSPSGVRVAPEMSSSIRALSANVHNSHDTSTARKKLRPFDSHHTVAKLTASTTTNPEMIPPHEMKAQQQATLDFLAESRAKRRLISALSVFPSSFDLKAASMVLNIDTGTLSSTVFGKTLTGAGMLEYDPGTNRYAVPFVVRNTVKETLERAAANANEHDDDDDLDTLHLWKARFVDHFLGVISELRKGFDTLAEHDETSDASLSVKRILYLELDNFEAAMVFAVQEALESDLVQLDYAVENLREIFRSFVSASQRIKVYESVISAIKSQDQAFAAAKRMKKAALKHESDDDTDEELNDDDDDKTEEATDSEPEEAEGEEAVHSSNFINYASSTPTITELTILNELGIAYFEEGVYSKSEEALETAQNMWESALGEDVLSLATILTNLGTLYVNQSRTKEAERIFARVLEIRSRKLGTKHPEFADAVCNMAWVFEKQGRYEETEPLLQQALEIYSSTLGASHTKIALVLNNLAALYNHKGQFDDAEKLYLEALTIKEEVMGLNHPSVASTLKNLGVLYNQQKKYDKAEQLLTRALSIFENTCGTEHVAVSQCLNNLAYICHMKDEHSQAEILYSRSLQVSQTVLGMNHPIVARTLSNLASVYRDKRMFEKAEGLYSKALTIRKQVLGPEHPEVAKSLHILGVLYTDWGMYEKAVPLYHRCLEIQRKLLGENHPDTVSTRNNLKLALEIEDRQKSTTCVVM